MPTPLTSSITVTFPGALPAVTYTTAEEFANSLDYDSDLPLGWTTNIQAVDGPAVDDELVAFKLLPETWGCFTRVELSTPGTYDWVEVETAQTSTTVVAKAKELEASGVPKANIVVAPYRLKYDLLPDVVLDFSEYVGEDGVPTPLPIASFTMTLGAVTDGGTTWDFPVEFELTDADANPVLGDFLSIGLIVRQADFLNAADTTFSDITGSTSTPFTPAYVLVSLDETTGTYSGVLRVTKSAVLPGNLFLNAFGTYAGDDGGSEVVANFGGANSVTQSVTIT